MANRIYPKYLDAILTGAANTSLTTNTVKIACVDTSLYTYSDTHEFLTSLTGVVGTAVTLTGKAVSNGQFSCASAVFPGLTGATVEAVVVYIDTGTASTSRLVAYIDYSVGGLPFTPDGGDITLSFGSSFLSIVL